MFAAVTSIRPRNIAAIATVIERALVLRAQDQPDVQASHEIRKENKVRSYKENFRHLSFLPSIRPRNIDAVFDRAQVLRP